MLCRLTRRRVVAFSNRNSSLEPVEDVFVHECSAFAALSGVCWSLAACSGAKVATKAQGARAPFTLAPPPDLVCAPASAFPVRCLVARTWPVLRFAVLPRNPKLLSSTGAACQATRRVYRARTASCFSINRAPWAKAAAEACAHTVLCVWCMATSFVLTMPSRAQCIPEQKELASGRVQAGALKRHCISARMETDALAFIARSKRTCGSASRRRRRRRSGSRS